MMTKRLFISIDVPAHIARQIGTIKRALARQEIFTGRFMPPSSLHCTIAFLGNTQENEIPLIIDHLMSIKQKPFNIVVDKLSCDSWKRPSIIWLLLSSSELNLLAARVAQVLKLSIKAQHFKAHITIARIKEVYSQERLQAFINAYKTRSLQWTVDHMMLQESITRVGGADYFPIAFLTLSA